MSDQGKKTLYIHRVVAVIILLGIVKSR